ncbi:MAG: Fic family protein [bacterium]
MDIAKFIAGTYHQRYHYKSFTPNPINKNWTWTDQKLNTLLAEANIKLGELNAFSLHIPDVEIFIQMHIVKEATTSSRIEGTRTGIEDALMQKRDINPEYHDDWQEVQNYIKAMNYAMKRLNALPLSTRLLQETHKVLMSGVRGKTKLPGEYRTSQNWIGGATLKDALFVPPHNSEISDLMGDVEKFLHNNMIDVPDLIKVAIAHYQFETIHPFLDGNGRLGRLLITLYLVSRGILSRPTLYLSEYFEKHRNLYYDHLTAVHDSNHLLQWIKFFLVGVAETSKKGITTFQKILKLKEDIEQVRLPKLGKKVSRGYALMGMLYRIPTVSAADVQNELKVTPKTANLLLQGFIELGIVHEATGRRRNRLFQFKKYLDLFTNE